MEVMWVKYKDINNRYQAAYRAEINKKYSTAVNGYFQVASDGLLFYEEYKKYLPADYANAMKNVLKAVGERMTVLRQAGYEPQTEPPPQQVTLTNTTTNIPSIRNSTVQPNQAPAKPVLPPRAGSKPTKPTDNSPKGNIDYDPNDPYEKNVVENESSWYRSPSVKWEDIAGMKYAKKVLYETVILPSKRPELFTGLRAPPKGILLFGPPGTGKTMLAKAVATESNALFFSISSSSLTSKWVGESEKTVKALFRVAYKNQPAIVFIDEIDSILTARSENENEASRRLKTEFLVQLDGAATNGEERVLIMGATNRPFELDDAVIRRMARRVYIPLPDKATRYELFKILLKKEKVNLSKDEVQRILDLSENYSGSDIKVLCKEAAMGPIREITDLERVDQKSIRDIQFRDFEEAFKVCSPSVNPASLKQYIDWNDSYGSKGDNSSSDEVEVKDFSNHSICKSY